MKFYTYSNNCVEGLYIIFESLTQVDSDTKAEGLGVVVGTGHREFTKTDSDTLEPQINGTVIANKVGDEWINSESGVKGQVIYNTEESISY